MKFSVSVIIPVYNAARFIQQAVASANALPEVIEIIVVNDGSTDGTVEILEKVQWETSKMKLIHHPNKINKGRSASRNLGIQSAAGNYIAFLDADDFYLGNRFQNDAVLFQNNARTDGVYNAIGFHYYREATLEERVGPGLTTVTEKIESHVLFENLLLGKKGYFSIDGLTVKKMVFEAIGYFNESLAVAEDTELILKMALKCKLEAGSIDRSLAMRGVHEENIFNQVDLYTVYHLKMYESLLSWCIKEKISNERINIILKLLWELRFKENNNLCTEMLFWMRQMVKNNTLLFSRLGYKYCPVIRQRKKLFPFLFKH
jgi:glycosyltransferase involved in cell wall biosynthesis